MLITVMIPVYKEAKRAWDLAEKLLRNHYSQKEIVIVIDGPVTPSIAELRKHLTGRVRFIHHEKNLGKVAALNTAIQQVNTDALLFFDNDILMPEDAYFLDKLADEFQNHDIIEIPKEAIVKSFISAMMRYEFLNMAIGNFIFAKFSKRCPYMNGAAFAIKKDLFDKLKGFRPVVHEDADIAARSFALHARYSYNPRLAVLNEVPVTIKDWVKQRKRWALNVVLWIRDNLAVILHNFVRDKHVRRSFYVMLIPFVAYPLTYALFSILNLPFFLPVIMNIGQQFTIIATLFLWASHANLISQGLLPAVVAIAITLLFNLGMAVRLKFKFNPLEFLFFYIFYSPVWVLFSLFFGLLVIFNVNVNLDWTITDLATKSKDIEE